MLGIRQIPMTTGKNYWRSLDEWTQTPEFCARIEREFPDYAQQLELDGPNRRQFLKYMGASLALAGLAGCRRWPEEKLAPFAYRPDGRSPGTTLQYATAMELNGVAMGLLVTSYDGRPIKIEGNPLHPASLGAASAIHQASVLELYDPERSRTIVQRQQLSVNKSSNKSDNNSSLNRAELGIVRTWDDWAAFAEPHFAAFKENGGAGLAVLSESASGPSMADIRQRWARTFPQARWYEYEPINDDHQREGLRQAFGRAVRPQLNLDQADVIVCIGTAAGSGASADIFGSHPNSLRYARDWADRRRAGLDVDRNANSTSAIMPRLYVIESTYSITGSVADHRCPMRHEEMIEFIEWLTHGYGEQKDKQKLSNVEEQKLSNIAFLKAIQADLAAHRGRGLIVVGEEFLPEVHARVAALNAQLGNVGHTITYIEQRDVGLPADSSAHFSTNLAAIQTLVRELREKKVQTLLILGGNPVYNAPADLAFSDAMAHAEIVVHLSLFENETSLRSHWHLPRAHYLESWGDARAWDGTVSIVQPLIEPLYVGKSSVELLSSIIGDEKTQGYDIVRRSLMPLLPKDDFERHWRRALHDGVVPNTAWETAKAPFDVKMMDVKKNEVSPDRSHATASELDCFELSFVADRKVFDGRFANNSWLQELPDPLTKITWDNSALIAVADADRLGIKTGDVIRIHITGCKDLENLNVSEIEIVVYVMPGQAARTIAVALGYGRSGAGSVGDGVGFNMYRLRTTSAMNVVVGVQVTKTAKRYELALTQDHHAMDAIAYQERHRRAPELIRELPLKPFREQPKFVQEMGAKPRHQQLWSSPIEYKGARWGMAVDLSSCIGCGACVVACQAENNVPIVGKHEVIVGRAMHWIRVDRYFSGSPSDANLSVAYQPMTCHHCENAPCETVCPVAATVHDTEGLNTMVYNRCVGTRYCSNNCPYKVRRFNYFDYHSKGPNGSRTPWLGWPDSQQRQHVDMIRRMGFNPDVTVRMRGVMEKCSYCVQRIMRAKIQARNENRELVDGEIVPACAQTCPTQTIVFGDLNDPHSRVRKLHEQNRAYVILDELNNRPRMRYLAKITNPNVNL